MTDSTPAAENGVDLIRKTYEFASANERGKVYGDFCQNMAYSHLVMGILCQLTQGRDAPPAVLGALHQVCLKLVRIMNSDWTTLPHEDSYIDAINYLSAMYEGHARSIPAPGVENLDEEGDQMDG